MGMAASQARLLTITARLHDVEYKAQSIQNAKIQLATQQDQVYQDYLEALDATTLTVKDYQGNRITANFNNLCSMNAVDNGQHYALSASNGKLIVPDDIKEAFDKFSENGGNDPYEFAMFMINGDDGQALRFNDLQDFENKIFELHKDDDSGASNSLTAIKKKLDEMGGIDEESYNALSNEDKDKYDELEQSYKFLLYKNYSDEIFEMAYKDEGVTKEDFNQDEFDYYARIFKEIQYAGGCISISDYDGPSGDASNDGEWLNNMIKCGKISIDVVTEDKKTGNIEFIASSVATDTYLEDTTTSTIDKTALAKAEAEYEHKTKQIDQKDKKFDMDLSKLETERTALTTEYESVKKVISENIERTFGIFS